jgi:hypothetical protein
MQLIPRYLVKERIIVLSSESGFIVEYRPVYTRELKVYRGIDNRLQFRLLNADQKPITITGTPIFVAFDENKNQVLKYRANVTDDGSSKETRGMFDVTITENDLLNIQQQYLNYNIYIDEGIENRQLTYASRDFKSSGIIYVDGMSFPGPKSSISISNFYPVGNIWIAGNTANDNVYAYPGVNGMDALHTVAIYSLGYIGTVKIQATLENQITGVNNWFDVQELEFDGSETEPVISNFNGVYRYLRFVLDADPTDLISKILIRN